MAIMFPGAAGSANAAFNPSRYYAEVGQTAEEIPGSSTTPGGDLMGSLKGIYLPLLVGILLLWFLERRRVGASLKVGV